MPHVERRHGVVRVRVVIIKRAVQLAYSVLPILLGFARGFSSSTLFWVAKNNGASLIFHDLLFDHDFQEVASGRENRSNDKYKAWSDPRKFYTYTNYTCHNHHSLFQEAGQSC